MKMITAISTILGLMIIGCAHTDEINVSGEISSIIIPETVELDGRINTTPQVIVTEPHKILLVELFLKNHSSGWEETWHTPMAPNEYVIINQPNSDSFSFGYMSNFLIKYKQGYYRQKQVSQDEIDEFKRLLETIKQVPTSGSS